jgi:hypothetical protein
MNATKTKKVRSCKLCGFVLTGGRGRMGGGNGCRGVHRPARLRDKGIIHLAEAHDLRFQGYTRRKGFRIEDYFTGFAVKATANA